MLKLYSRRRAVLLAPLLLALVAFAPGCPLLDDGYVNASWWRTRQNDWLAFATATPINPGSVANVMAHIEREQRSLSFDVPAGSIPDDAWDGIIEKMFRLRDTSDFDALRFVDLLYGYRGHPAASEALWQKAEQALLDFKYWYTDPTPARMFNGSPVVDNMWYWTENHVLIFKTCEYLAGQMFPDRVFTVTGLTGQEHMDRARPFILDWIDERGKLGFTEWHSNVYYTFDIRPLLSLVEWADDAEIVKRSKMVLDLVLMDIALHLHRGTFGATHGRSYIKDKASASNESTFEVAKIFFDDTVLPYADRGNPTAAGLSRARRYRLPEAIRRIALHDAPMVDRQRMNLPLDEEPPADPTVNPPAPFGWDYTDETYLPFWWTMGSQTLWMMIPLTFEVADRENLWDSQFADFADLAGLFDVPGAQNFTKLVWQAINMALLKEVNTYTYRNADYMLSTAQSYRPGLRGSQTQISQATLSENAMVFVTHPGYLPVAPGDPVPPNWNWQQQDEPGPGYWTGNGAEPRAAQHENVSIQIYSPAYPNTGFDALGFGYRPETHAYFPVAHFDEVVRAGHWTFGRKDDGYVALWSWRDVAWRGGQPEVFQNGGLDFDLVAEGGPDNVWIMECGNLDQWPGGFAAFQAAFHDGLVVVTPTAVAYDVAYTSPTQGAMSLGWTGPLMVAGDAKPLEGYPRFDNPFVHTDWLDTRYEVEAEGYSLVLDFDTNTRQAAAP